MSVIESPCVNICVMHPSRDICVGCFRTMDEIVAWASLAPDLRRTIMAELPARRESLKKRRES